MSVVRPLCAIVLPCMIRKIPKCNEVTTGSNRIDRERKRVKEREREMMESLGCAGKLDLRSGFSSRAGQCVQSYRERRSPTMCCFFFLFFFKSIIIC